MIELGDIVRLGSVDDGYCDATVIAVHPSGEVDVFRSYVHTSDFSCGGRDGRPELIAYLGFERIDCVRPENLKLLRKGRRVR